MIKTILSFITLFDAKLFALLFILQPLIEYFGHRVVHIYRYHYHIAHHRTWSGGSYSSYGADTYVLLFIIGALYTRHYKTGLVLLKYEVTHTMAHICPSYYMYRHHQLHHTHPGNNFAFSVMWPDRLFGTFIE